MKQSLILGTIGLLLAALGLVYTEWQAQKLPPRPTLSPTEIRLNRLETEILELENLEDRLDLPELTFPRLESSQPATDTLAP
jgi:hypothetical protein